MKAKALVATDLHQVELASVELPEPGPGEVLLETLYSCISPGTELRCLAGKQPGTVFPFIPGYALVGRVIKAGSAAGVAEGSVAFVMGSDYAGKVHLMWGCHISHAVCAANKLQIIPAGVDLVEASAAKLASIPYHGLRLCRPLPEERIAVIGLGPIGHMAAKLYVLSGANTVACDVSASRVEQAEAAGIVAVKAGTSLKESFAPHFPDGADAVIDCTGAPALLESAVEVCRELPWGDHAPPAPRYLVQGSYADTFSVPYQAAFLRELSFILPRSEQNRDRLVIFELIKRGQLSLKSVISEVSKPADGPRVYRELGERGTKLMTVVFDWSKTAG
ncbi:MAG TPA: zinc-binding alcohol dehydrogenase [Polyangiaceae bacterium]|jgi:3-hydroxyethyl bacteriochlorophyllide a dehydrogenase|nr:zinc-binding alcohol dehydrogenase [Polyangiaceae bacterium]